MVSGLNFAFSYISWNKDSSLGLGLKWRRLWSVPEHEPQTRVAPLCKQRQWSEMSFHNQTRSWYQKYLIPVVASFPPALNSQWQQKHIFLLLPNSFLRISQGKQWAVIISANCKGQAQILQRYEKQSLSVGNSSISVTSNPNELKITEDSLSSSKN